MFPPKLASPEKSVLPTPRRAMRFFPDLLATNQRGAPCPENTLSHIINLTYTHLGE